MPRMVATGAQRYPFFSGRDTTAAGQIVIVQTFAQRSGGLRAELCCPHSAAPHTLSVPERVCGEFQGFAILHHNAPDIIGHAVGGIGFDLERQVDIDARGGR
jgi:hypothetical protein